MKAYQLTGGVFHTLLCYARYLYLQTQLTAPTRSASAAS